MGYKLKNRELESEGSAVTVPFGPTALRPAAPTNGQMRFNTDTTRFEIYYNAWKEVAILGNVTITKDTFTGDGSTVIYTMTKSAPSDQAVQINVGNVHQNPSIAYTTSGSTLTFNAIPPNGQTIEVYHGFASTDAN